MKFDYILINPPFSLGNDVAQECLKHTDNVICLMPLSKFKKGNLWSKIVDFELADPSLFQDATITPNLCITRLVPNPDKDGKFEKETDFQLKSYDQDFRLVYEYNLDHKGKAILRGGRPNSSVAETYKINNKTWFKASLRATDAGVHGEDSENYQWNHKTDDSIQINEDGCLNSFYFEMPSEKAKDNLTKWWYYKGKNGLTNSLLKGMNKGGGSCEDAIPQIDWEQIEKNPYWKTGDYDAAVLDEMNLKMVDGKVVRKNIQEFENEDAFVLESYNPELREVYQYNRNHSIFSESASMGDEKTLIKKGVENKTWFAISVRVVKDGARGESSWSYQWNHKRTTELKVTEKGLVGSSFYKLKSEKAKDNLTKWWHSSEKSCLANRLILGLNKTSGSCEDAIPQIDWESIENNSYWKQGQYDEAVLDEMNLKMVDGKVVRK